MIEKLEFWAACVLGVLAGIAVAVLYGYAKGKQHAAAKVQQAKQQVADVTATLHANEERQHVDTEVQAAPPAAPQKLADADPVTAAGQLRDDGWLRDDAAPKPKG